MSELAQRIVFGSILAAAALLLTYAGLWPFVALICAGSMVLAWEWSGITASRTGSISVAVHAAILVAAILLTAMGQAAAGLGVLGVSALAAVSIQRRPALASGILYCGLPAVALVALRADPEMGWPAVLFLFTVVWCADTMAYFCGKSFGGPKVAPSISPGKTWSGAVGGALFPAILGFLFAHWLGGTSPFALAFVAAGLAIISQIGDFAESAIKRRAGVKDSSALIPGHGGFLDRVDALIFAAVAAGIIALIRNPDSPGKALLAWS